MINLGGFLMRKNNHVIKCISLLETENPSLETSQNLIEK